MNCYKLKATTNSRSLSSFRINAAVNCPRALYQIAIDLYEKVTGGVKMNRAIALNEFTNCLFNTCGYTPANAVEDYKFIFRQTIEVADMVIFSDNDRYDVSTSCIALVKDEGEERDYELLEKYKTLTTPIITFLDSEEARIYDLRKPTLKCNKVSYKLLEQHFSMNRVDYAKKNLLLAKKLPHLYQLTLFSLDATKKLLVETFEQAIFDEINKLPIVKQNDDVIEAAIYILAACILEDKLWPKESPSPNVKILLEKCANKYPEYFRDILAKEQSLNVDAIFNRIRSNLVFTTVTHDMLGHFYEHAILDKSLRQELGIYWTNECIAKNICHCLPFENIPLDQRIVLDGTCGSASLLIAACDRLDSLLPVKMKGQDRHNWLTERIIGVEKEKISAKIAKLALLLYSIPYGNKWRIRNVDFQHYEPELEPSIIVANPPFKEMRTEEKAAEFLNRYLDLLKKGGIMAIVLPRSYLENPKCQNSRRKLLQLARILEVWYLPEKVFDNSEIATTVILLKKHTKESSLITNYLTKVNEVTQTDFKNFLETGNPSLTIFYNAKQWIDDPYNRIYFSTLDSVLESVVFKYKLKDVVRIRQGIIPQDSKDFSDIKLPEDDQGHWGRWLQSVSNRALEPYKIEVKKQKGNQYFHKVYTRYPGNHYQKAQEVNFSLPKVITNVARNSRGFWRIYGAIDTSGLYVSQRFFIFFNPMPGISLEEITAVINNPITNAFISKYNRRAYLNISNLEEIPFPNFSKRQQARIIDLVQRLMKLKKESIYNWKEEARSITCKLDDIVFDAFGVSESLRVLIKMEAEASTRPGEEWFKYSKKREKRIERKNSFNGPIWKMAGSILSINVFEKSMKLNLEGFDEHIDIPIPASTPGWALEEGQDVEIEIPFSQRYLTNFKECTLIKFRILNDGCLSEEEIEKRFAKNWITVGDNINE